MTISDISVRASLALRVGAILDSSIRSARERARGDVEYLVFGSYGVLVARLILFLVLGMKLWVQER